MPRGIPLDLSDGTKHCPKCGTVKLLADFHKSKATKTGYQVYCAPCSRVRHDGWRRENLKHVAKNAKKWRDNNPERSHDLWLKSKYGLELGGYERMLAAQSGGCAICQRKDPGGRVKRFHVDHCHSSQRIRGLLCHGCNVSIGHFAHNPALLRAAINYLAEGS